MERMVWYHGDRTMMMVTALVRVIVVMIVTTEMMRW